MITPQPKVITRWLRYVCYAVVVVLLWQFLSDFSFVKVSAGDNSVLGVTGRRSLVVKNYNSEQARPERGEIVVFLMEGSDGAPIKRVARVAGLPGDTISAGKEFLEVNGAPTVFRAPDTGRLAGRIPDGMYLLLNDNPYSTFADSRRTGLIPRQVILGRFLVESPF